MEIREKLMRNEILHLAENLRVISQELITLQDFVRKEFGSKYVRFCEGRRDEEGECVSSQSRSQTEKFPSGISLLSVSSLRQPERQFSSSGNGTSGSDSYGYNSQPKRPRSSLISIEPIGTVNERLQSQNYFENNTDPLEIQEGDEDTLKNLDTSNPAIFTEWETETVEEEVDLYIHSDVEEEEAMYQEATDRKRKSTETCVSSEKDTPESQPISLLRFVKGNSHRGTTDRVALGGYIYHMNNKHEQTVYYLCNSRKRGCKARLILKKDKGTFVQKGLHSHAPVPDRIREQELIYAGKQLASTIEDPTNTSGCLGSSSANCRIIQKATGETGFERKFSCLEATSQKNFGSRREDRNSSSYSLQTLEMFESS